MEEYQVTQEQRDAFIGEVQHLADDSRYRNRSFGSDGLAIAVFGVRLLIANMKLGDLPAREHHYDRPGALPLVSVKKNSDGLYTLREL